MRNLFVFYIAFLWMTTASFAQAGINTDHSAPDNSAMLDVKSATKGMLIPRLTSAQRMAIVSPANGLMVSQIGGVGGVYYYNGSIWQRIGESDGSETKVTAGANVSVTGTGTLVSPYVIDASFGSSAHYIGELFGGGIVYWLDHTGQHGLIVSLINISQSSAWSNISNVRIGSPAQSTWNGQGNSTAIMGQAGHVESAAKLCDNYSNNNYGTGVYTDWYLPAVDQLSLIYHARCILNEHIAGVSGANTLADTYYFSSTEVDMDKARDYYFNYGFADYTMKNFTNWVRCVRDF
jgi:hypothetical protein